jgi:DNA-binding CsgD family transcriptional regulator
MPTVRRGKPRACTDLGADLPATNKQVRAPILPARHPEGILTVPTRQLDCLRLVAQGLSIRQIARRLNVHESTVRDQLANTRARLGARTTTHAVAIAVAVGLITVDAKQDLPVDLALGRIAAALGYVVQLAPAAPYDTRRIL